MLVFAFAFSMRFSSKYYSPQKPAVRTSPFSGSHRWVHREKNKSFHFRFCILIIFRATPADTFELQRAVKTNFDRCESARSAEGSLLSGVEITSSSLIKGYVTRLSATEKSNYLDSAFLLAVHLLVFTGHQPDLLISWTCRRLIATVVRSLNEVRWGGENRGTIALKIKTD